MIRLRIKVPFLRVQNLLISNCCQLGQYKCNRVGKLIELTCSERQKMKNVPTLFQSDRALAVILTILGQVAIALSLPGLSQVRSTNPPNLTQNTKRLIFNDVQGGVASIPKTVTLRNTGSANLTINNVTLGGTNANQFQITSPAKLPLTLAAGKAVNVSIAFNPTTPGPKAATVQIKSNDPDTPISNLSLRGLGTKGIGGSNEPSLQWILSTYEIPLNVGDVDPTNNDLVTTTPLGDEVILPRFQKAGTGLVTVQPIAVFGPQSNTGVLNFGYYTSGNANRKQLFSVPNNSYQSLNPIVIGNRSFDPGTSSFGFYSIWPFFNNRNIYSEDNLNTFTGAIPHHVRVYPLKRSDGTIVPNAYVVATEEFTGAFDYQDIVVIVRNVKPANIK